MIQLSQPEIVTKIKTAYIMVTNKDSIHYYAKQMLYTTCMVNKEQGWEHSDSFIHYAGYTTNCCTTTTQQLPEGDKRRTTAAEQVGEVRGVAGI